MRSVFAASIQWPFQPPRRAAWGRPRWCSRRPGGDDDLAALERRRCRGVLQLSRSSPCAGAACRRRCWCEKNTGSMRAKSPSACMRSIRRSRPCRAIRPILRECHLSLALHRKDAETFDLPGRFAGGWARRTELNSFNGFVMVLPAIAATTASPMARVPTLVLPSAQMSPVRRPARARAWTADSMRSAAFGLVQEKRSIMAADRIVASGFEILTGDVGRAAVAGLVQAPPARSTMPRAACRSSRSASPPRRTGCRRTCCR